MCQTVLISSQNMYYSQKEFKHFGLEMVEDFELYQVLNCFKYFLNIYFGTKYQNALIPSNCIH